MPTDTDRREAARRLREIRPCRSGHIEWWKIAQALGLKEPVGWFGWEKFEPDSVMRLADLIDPGVGRTCRQVVPPYEPGVEEVPVCSVCGRQLLLDDDDGYCPRCGAKVVDDDD